MDLAEQLAQTNMLNRKVLSRLDKTTHKFDDDPFSARNLGVALQKLTKGSLFKSIGSSIQDSLRTKTSEYLRVVPFMENRANKMMERVEDNAKLQDLSEDVLSANNKYKKLLDHLNSGKIATEDQFNQVLDDFKDTQKEIIELQTQQLQVEAKYLSGDALQANFALQQELVSTLKGVDLSEVSLSQDKPLEVQTTVTPEEERIIENRERKNTDYLADNYKETVGDSTVTLGQKIDELREDVVRELRKNNGGGSGGVISNAVSTAIGAGAGVASSAAIGSMVGTAVTVATYALPILLAGGVLATLAIGLNSQLFKEKAKETLAKRRKVKDNYSPEAWRLLLQQSPNGTYDEKTSESLIKSGKLVDHEGKYFTRSQANSLRSKPTPPPLLLDPNLRNAQEKEEYIKTNGESAWEDKQVEINARLDKHRSRSKDAFIKQYGQESWDNIEQGLVNSRDNWVEEEWRKTKPTPETKPKTKAPPTPELPSSKTQTKNVLGAAFDDWKVKQREKLGTVPYTESKLKNENTYNKLFEEAGRAENIDPLLLKSIAKQESRFNPDAVSPKGAKGIMQLMSGTAKDMGVKDRSDPRESIMGGAKYLRKMIDMHDGNVELGLAAYNAGPGRLKQYDYDYSRIKETKDYVPIISKNYEEYKNSRDKVVETTRVEPNVDVKDKKIDNYVKTQVTKDQTVQVNPAPAQPSTSSPTAFSTTPQGAAISPSADFNSDYGVELLRSLLT